MAKSTKVRIGALTNYSVLANSFSPSKPFTMKKRMDATYYHYLMNVFYLLEFRVMAIDMNWFTLQDSFDSRILTLAAIIKDHETSRFIVQANMPDKPNFPEYYIRQIKFYLESLKHFPDDSMITLWLNRRSVDFILHLSKELENHPQKYKIGIVNTELYSIENMESMCKITGFTPVFNLTKETTPDLIFQFLNNFIHTNIQPLAVLIAENDLIADAIYSRYRRVSHTLIKNSDILGTDILFVGAKADENASSVMMGANCKKPDWKHKVDTRYI